MSLSVYRTLISGIPSRDRVVSSDAALESRPRRMMVVRPRSSPEASKTTWTSFPPLPGSAGGGRRRISEGCPKPPLPGRSSTCHEFGTLCLSRGLHHPGICLVIRLRIHAHGNTPVFTRPTPPHHPQSEAGLTLAADREQRSFAELRPAKAITARSRSCPDPED